MGLGHKAGRDYKSRPADSQTADHLDYIAIAD